MLAKKYLCLFIYLIKVQNVQTINETRAQGYKKMRNAKISIT